MKFHCSTINNLASINTELLIVAVQGKLYNSSAQNGALDELLAELNSSEDFKGKNKQQLLLLKPEGFSAKRLLLLGLGDKQLTDKAAFDAAKLLGDTLEKQTFTDISVVLPEAATEESTNTQFISDIVTHAIQASYRYTKTLSKPADATKVQSINVYVTEDQLALANDAVKQGIALGRGLSVTRELGNLPANFCTPSDLQKTAESLSEQCEDLSVKTIEESDMRELGMGSLLSVAAGSTEPAKLICLEYNGKHDDSAPIALVGKGVTFDTGGISLKPGAKMDEMKYDMCGAATVMGIFKALTELRPNINVVGIIPATENMPAGNATKPGDVVTSMAGKTIEILNTDAEGRLILCDALTYAGKYKPKAVIDIATLTGACIVALGHHRTAVYSNNDELMQALVSAGNSSQDLCWPMPLDESYTKQLKSRFADLANIGGPAAGSVTAACFLAEFTKDYNWAHMDIAGTAWNSPGIKGASGRPVSLLFSYLLAQA